MDGDRFQCKDGRSEIVTTGIDEELQLIGGDAYGHINSVGLRVPTLATALAAPVVDGAPFPNPLIGRYLFMLASFSIAAGANSRIRGWRQLLTIGVKQHDDELGFTRVAEQLVTSPFWRFQDGNVSWHLMDMGPPGAQGVPNDVSNPNDLENFTFRNSITPALLYETATLPVADPFYIDLTAYTPPNQGRPWGTSFLPGFTTMYDLREPWSQGGLQWQSLDIPIAGPRTIALFASIRQTNPNTRVTLHAPATFYPEGLSQEEQFLLNFPNAIYWRVGASLIVDSE